jgi:hypothetical protein
LKQAFRDMLLLLGQPFHNDTFDFGNEVYFKAIHELGDKFSKMVEIKEANGARGPQDAIYINRTCFGLYSVLNIIGAKVDTAPKS